MILGSRRRAAVRPLAVLAAALAALALPPAAAAQDRGPPSQPPGGFDARVGRAPGAELDALVGKPRIVDSDHYNFDDAVSGERRMAGWVEAEIVIDAPVRYVAAAINDPTAFPSFMPMILGAEVLEESPGRQLIRYRVGIRFLGFEVGYATIEESVFEWLPNGSGVNRSRLIDSPDGNMFEHYVSVYIEPVYLSGREMCYLRYFNRPGLRKPFPGMLSVAKAFIPGGTRSQLQAIEKEAKRLAGR